MSLRQKQNYDLHQHQKTRLPQLARQVQELTCLPTHQLELKIEQALAQNQALYLDTEPSDLDEPVTEDEEGWNPDWSKPDDEWEDGRGPFGKDVALGNEPFDLALALEQVVESWEDCTAQEIQCARKAIDDFRATGVLPQEADGRLKEALARLRQMSHSFPGRALQAVFAVQVMRDRVVAAVVSSLADQIGVRDGVGKVSSSAKTFAAQLRQRRVILQGLAQGLLEEVQGEFFRQPTLQEALLSLVPVPWQRFREVVEPYLPEGSKNLLPKEKKNIQSYRSKLGSLGVMCSHGMLPLELFWPSKAQLVRVWVSAAQRAGCSDQTAIRVWILNELPKRFERGGDLTPSVRQDLAAELLAMTTHDIGNAIKKRKSHKPSEF